MAKLPDPPRTATLFTKFPVVLEKRIPFVLKVFLVNFKKSSSYMGLGKSPIIPIPVLPSSLGSNML